MNIISISRILWASLMIIMLYVPLSLSLQAQFIPVALPPTNTTATTFNANTLALYPCCKYSIATLPSTVLDVATDSTFPESSYLPGYRRQRNSFFTDNTTTNTISVGNLLPNSTYYYRFVYIVDTLILGVQYLREVSFSNVQRVRTLPSLVPGTPIPNISYITDKSFLISWQPVPMAEYYLLDIYLQRPSNTALTGFDSLIIARNLKITSTSYHAQNLPPDRGKYLYNLRAANAHGVSTYNNCGGCLCQHNFGFYLTSSGFLTIKDSSLLNRLRIDAVAYHQTPVPAQNKDSSYFFIDVWTGGIAIELDDFFQSQTIDSLWAEGQYYRTSGLYCSPEYDNNPIGVSLRLIVHVSNKEKFFQLFGRNVRPLTRSFIPNYPLLYRYTFANTTTSTLTSPDAANRDIRISPNPATEAATISLSLPASSPVRLTLHDALGCEVRTVTEGVYAAGAQEFSVPLDGLPSGIYFLRCNVGGQVLVRRLVVVR